MRVEARAATDTAGSRRRWPWVRCGLTVAILVTGVVAAVSRREQLSDAASRLGHVHQGWVLVAVALEAASMVAFARLQRRLLAAGGVAVGLAPMIGITLAANAVALSLPGGTAFSATWSFGQLRQRGSRRLLAGWVVLMSGALSSFALFVVLAAGTELAGGRGPVASLRPLALGLAAIPVVLALLAIALPRLMPLRRNLVDVVVQLQRQPGRGRVVQLGRRLVDNVRLVQPTTAAWAEAFGLAALNWLADLGCLIAAVYAVGGEVPWRGILVAYGLAQLLVALPFTPGGLALVEGSLTALLIAYGMHSETALAAVLLYRLVSFWSLVPVGWGAYGWLTVSERNARGRGPDAAAWIDVSQQPAEGDAVAWVA